MPGSNILIDETGRTFISRDNEYTRITPYKIYDLIAAGFKIYKFDLSKEDELKLYRILTTNGGLTLYNATAKGRRGFEIRKYNAANKTNIPPENVIDNINATYPIYTIESLEPYKMSITGGKKTRKTRKRRTRRTKKTRRRSRWLKNKRNKKV